MKKQILTLNDSNFEVEVQKTGLLMVCFWGAWCGICIKYLEVLENVSLTFPELRVAKINVDENKLLSRQNRVSVLPVVFLYKNGVFQNRIETVQSEQELKRIVHKYTNES